MIQDFKNNNLKKNVKGMIKKTQEQSEDESQSDGED